MKFILVWRKTLVSEVSKWWGPDGFWLDSIEGVKVYDSREVAVTQRRFVAKRSGVPEARVSVAEHHG